MKKPRIKMPAIPSSIIRQPNGMYRCCKTLKWYSLSTLQRLYGTEAKTQPKQEDVSPEMKHEQITNSRWDLNY